MLAIGGHYILSKLEWESYNWRKSLIRILKFLANEGIIYIVDDESAGFLTKGFNEDGGIAGEALYEVSSMARYLLRSFPKELQAYSTLDELLRADFSTDVTEEARDLRHKCNRIYRELLLSPVYYRNDKHEPDFVYLRNRRLRLEEAIQEWFGLHLELYHNAAMAVSHEQSSWVNDIFPVRFRGIHDIILHFSHYLRQLPSEEKSQPWSMSQWMGHLEKLAEMTKKGWTKEFREMSIKRLSETLLDEMLSWGMISMGDDGLLVLQPALFRNEGVYPGDYYRTP